MKKGSKYTYLSNDGEESFIAFLCYTVGKI